jgi:hypothetical protein
LVCVLWKIKHFNGLEVKVKAEHTTPDIGVSNSTEDVIVNVHKK